ncbi:hypothetical protein ACWGJ9_11945 [Curtobacterium citreum]
MIGEQNGPVRSGRARRFSFGKPSQAAPLAPAFPAAPPAPEPSGSKLGLIDVIAGIAVALVLLVGGTLGVTVFLSNARGEHEQQQPAAYCVDEYGNPAPPGACR